MKKIDKYEVLQDERRLAKQKIKLLEQQIEEDIADIKESLNPIRIAGNAVRGLFSSQRSGLAGESIDLTVDALIKDLLLKRTNWMFKLAVSFFLKNYAKNTFSKNSDSILHWVKSKIRQVVSKPKASQYETVTDDVNWDI